MPDAVATPKEGSEAVDSQAQEVDTKEQAQEIDLQEADSHEQEVEVACPHCDRPTSVRVSNDEAEIHVRPSIAGYGEHSTASCADGHEFWIYYC
jgi:hypothetical protein